MFDEFSDIQTISEIVKRSHARLDANGWDFLAGGAETETALRRNRQALDQLAFRPRVLCDVSDIDPAIEFLGLKQRIPVLLAPIGGIKRFLHPEGGLPIARAADRFGVTQIASSVCGSTPEELAASSESPLIFQYYVHDGVEVALETLDRVTELGYAAFCLTADTAYSGRRDRDTLKGTHHSGVAPQMVRPSQPGLDWSLVDKVRARTKIPLILKGIMTAEDAAEAIRCGADVVYVSNHGGRQPDHAVGSIGVLPEVLAAVDGKAEVVVDGGFSRGTDVLKALALGAKAVAIGRLCGYGLTAGGEAGIHRVLEILETEIVNALGLLGVSRIEELTRNHIHQGTPVREPSVLSAFPLIEIPERSY